MKMELLAMPPSKIQNKAVSKHELVKYFGNGSISSLILALRQGRYDGYFNFDVTVDSEYLVEQENQRKVLLRIGGNYQPHELGIMLPDTSGLGFLSTKISSNTPLTEQEITRAITESASGILDEYMRFTLRDVDYKKLRETVKPAKRRTEFGDYKYKGLAISGANVTYQGRPIYMSFQQREVLRIFLEKPETLITRDVLREDGDIFGKSRYSDVDVTLGKLIPAVHKKLQQVIGAKCIFNTPKEGWTFKIE